MENKTPIKTEGEMTKNLEHFLKKVFCIDGECKILPSKIMNVIFDHTESRMFELIDSKRGKFFITISTEAPEEPTNI